jgi:hypothetical protein
MPAARLFMAYIKKAHQECSLLRWDPLEAFFSVDNLDALLKHPFFLKHMMIKRTQFLCQTRLYGLQHWSNNHKHYFKHPTADPTKEDSWITVRRVSKEKTQPTSQEEEKGTHKLQHQEGKSCSGAWQGCLAGIFQAGKFLMRR